MDGVLTVWVITWRIAWPLVLGGTGLLLVALLSHTPAFVGRLPPVRAVAVPLLAPLLLVAWSGAHWATARDNARLVSNAHHWLFALCLIVAIVWPIVFRRTRAVGFVVAAGVVGFLYSIAAWFIGSMAIADVWL